MNHLTNNKPIGKRLARIASIQFMYQRVLKDDYDNINIGTINDFINTYLDKETNLKFFKRLVSHFQENIDFEKIINDALDGGKSLCNASVVGKCILKTAIIEIMFEKTDIPVIINEYIEIAKDFLNPKAVKFFNVIIDRVSKRIERRCLV